MEKFEEYDVVIIGGGITGAGTARDCSLRGLRTLLVEKYDLTNGATACSTAARAMPSPTRSRHANASRRT